MYKVYKIRLLSREAHEPAHTSRVVPRKEISFCTTHYSLSKLALHSSVNKTVAMNVIELNRSCIHRSLIEPLFVTLINFYKRYYVLEYLFQ